MDTQVEETLGAFIDLSLITEVLHRVKSGKEATVYCCKAHPGLRVDYVAAKVYKQLKGRSFKNDAVYQEGRLHGNSRERRAYETKTGFGDNVHFALWVGQEWEALNKLYRAGVHVPAPIKAEGPAILMEFYGEGREAAPTLQNARLDRRQALTVWRLLKANMEMMLGANFVHGDLSPYNILVDIEDESDPIRIIDLPQAMDARFNPNAKAMLERDVLNVYRYFEKLGVREDAKGYAHWLWRQHKHAKL